MVMAIVLFSFKFELGTHFEFLECDASIPLHKSSDVAMEEMFPLLCSLFHNRKC